MQFVRQERIGGTAVFTLADPRRRNASSLDLAGQFAVFDSRFISIPIHPGGGHTWMLTRGAGPQAAAAMTLFGEPAGGVSRPEYAARIGGTR
jgi:enoyl-CoA hydratase/carnithine racemase